MPNKRYDVVVVGAGPAGYVAAIRCAQLGLSTACIEQWLDPRGKPALGGTCLNVGCIPSKALLDSSHHFHFMQHDATAHGIIADGVRMDVGAMLKRKNRIVTTLTKGIEGLFRKNGIEWLQGTGRLTAHEDSGTKLTVTTGEQITEVEAVHVIVATGSVPAQIPVAKVDGDKIVDSTGALAFDEVPRRLGVIGAGVIGLELGSVWRRLGSEVVVLEAMNDFLPSVDQELAREAQSTLGEQGLDIRLQAQVAASTTHAGGVKVGYKTAEGPKQLDVDRLVVAVGRKPNTTGLNAEAVGLKLDERGYVEVDAYCQTNLKGVYAVGDVVRGPMLAHKGSEEGAAVAERIVGEAGHVNYAAIPWVIYTWPEIAWVGKTEEQLKSEGVDYRTGSFPFMASGRARAMGDTTGKVKILADGRTDRILGVHIFGPQASELIAEAVTAIEFDGSSEDLARTVHAHPTLAEAMHEAALAVDKRAVHI